MNCFGESTAEEYTRHESLRIARFLRREPLWPLLKAIFKLRMLDESFWEAAGL